MRQRQPHRADLLPSGRDAVDDAAADDEMTARVVVAQREAEMRVVHGDEYAATCGAGSGRERHRPQPRRLDHLLSLPDAKSPAAPPQPEATAQVTIPCLYVQN